VVLVVLVATAAAAAAAVKELPVNCQGLLTMATTGR
jgi:hypothetical protein